MLQLMKTAVSIPDDIFDRAERLARERRVSRSQLYASALQAMISDNDETTAKLNEIFESVAPDAALTSAARRVFANSDW
jgi:metal-responsive CopG/Arc/MetJ family transcriptional regulator